MAEMIQQISSFFFYFLEWPVYILIVSMIVMHLSIIKILGFLQNDWGYSVGG